MNACILVLADTSEDISQTLSRCQERKGTSVSHPMDQILMGILFHFCRK
jgi:hypothetical protein